MLLTSTSDILRLITSDTGVISVQANWADITTSSFTPGRTNTSISTASTTTVVGSPLASTQRQVKDVSIHNSNDYFPTNVRAQHFDGSTSVDLVDVLLRPNNTLQYNGSRWSVLDSYGNTLSSVGSMVAGTSGNIQYNFNGMMSGSDGLVWDYTTNELELNGTDTSFIMNGITNEPSAPNSNFLRIYSKNVGGRMLPKWIGPAGLDTPFQPAFFGNNITMWNPTTATAGVWLGTAGAGAGTYSTILPAATSLIGSGMKRGAWANVVTTPNQVLGQRNTEAMYYRGNNPGQGGFFFFARWGMGAVPTGGSRCFVGMHTATTVVSADPSASLNIAGFGWDQSDPNNAMYFMHNDGVGVASKDLITGAPTKYPGMAFDSYIYCKPNDNKIYYRLTDINSGITYVNSVTNSDLPVNTTMLTAGVLASNAGLIPVGNTRIDLNRIYIETDY